MKRLVPLLLLLACYTQAVGQYRGGGNDGVGLIAASALLLFTPGTSYIGGANDGIASVTGSALPLNATIATYSGGANDGTGSFTVPGIALGASSMFAGGNNDGEGAIAASSLVFIPNNNMYAGGSNDGFNSATASSLALTGLNPGYAGGANDGTGSVLATALTIGASSMYAGGANDGENNIAALSLNFVPTAKMYAGGSNDGYSSASAIVNVALPILWEEFTAVRNEKNALLNWKLADENGIEGYEIERSFDGANFKSIGYTNVHGGVFTSAAYSYTDIDPAAHCSNNSCTQVFYRIREINYDKKFSYSATRRLPLDISVVSITVYPNPATDKINIRWNLPGGQDINYDVALYNTTGELITSSKGLTAITHETDIQQLPNGSYCIKITSGNKTYINEVTIIH